MSVSSPKGLRGKKRGEDQFLDRFNHGLEDGVDRGVRIVQPSFVEKDPLGITGDPVRSTEGNDKLPTPVVTGPSGTSKAKARSICDPHQLPVR